MEYKSLEHFMSHYSDIFIGDLDEVREHPIAQRLDEDFVSFVSWLDNARNMYLELDFYLAFSWSNQFRFLVDNLVVTDLLFLKSGRVFVRMYWYAYLDIKEYILGLEDFLISTSIFELRPSWIWHSDVRMVTNYWLGRDLPYRHLVESGEP